MHYIQKIFNRDLRELLGFDIFRTVEDLEYILSSDWINHHHRMVIDAIKWYKDNLHQVCLEYFNYDQERFPNPMDQYIWIYESRFKIMEIVGRNLEVEGYEQPICCCLFISLELWFKRLFDNILTCGRTHKFNPATLGETPHEED